MGIHKSLRLPWNKEILGIPLILYMVLALNINIDNNSSIVDIYDRIFSLDGGIYDRCIDNKNFADVHRISVIKNQIHQISREIGIWMFENNSSEAYIPQSEYQKICNEVMHKSGNKTEILQQDFKIGNYFKLVKHCEGVATEDLYFIHRSIYEYFVAEYIYKSISDIAEVSAKELARILGKLLKGNLLKNEILRNLKYKIKLCKINNLGNIINDAFHMMLNDGMIYYTNQCYKNIFKCEMNVFANMLEIIHMFEGIDLKYTENMHKYLKINLNYSRQYKLT